MFYKWDTVPGSVVLGGVDLYCPTGSKGSWLGRDLAAGVWPVDVLDNTGPWSQVKVVPLWHSVVHRGGGQCKEGQGLNWEEGRPTQRLGCPHSRLVLFLFTVSAGIFNSGS